MSQSCTSCLYPGCAVTQCRKGGVIFGNIPQGQVAMQGPR